MKESTKLAFVIATILLSILVFEMALNSSAPALVKFVISVLVLSACGIVISHVYDFENWNGIFLLRSKKGLASLDRIARRHKKLCKLFYELGMVIGFGSLAYFALGKKSMDLKRKAIIFGVGTFLLVIVSGLVPLAMSLLLNMVSGGEEFVTAGIELRQTFSDIELFRYISIAAMVVGGISLTTTLSIVLFALLVGYGVLQAVLGNAAPLLATPPGGMPIIPGVNLDLVQGIIALAIILVVHEGAHGIIARLFKIPLKSAGLVFFGFLPFGAFVDIDEKLLLKAKKEKQNAVFVAGTAANFATGIFLLAIIIIYATFAGSAPSEPVRYIGRLLVLTFSLNIIVAAINLVPLPLFDGYHIMKNIVGGGRLAKIIAYVVAIAGILTLLPWLFR